MTNQESIDKLLALSSWLEKDSELYQAIVMAISALQAQEWIPCKERLPKKSKRIIGYVLMIIGKVRVNGENIRARGETFGLGI